MEAIWIKLGIDPFEKGREEEAALKMGLSFALISHAFSFTIQ